MNTKPHLAALRASQLSLDTAMPKRDRSMAIPEMRMRLLASKAVLVPFVVAPMAEDKTRFIVIDGGTRLESIWSIQATSDEQLAGEESSTREEARLFDWIPCHVVEAPTPYERLRLYLIINANNLTPAEYDSIQTSLETTYQAEASAIHS